MAVYDRLMTEIQENSQQATVKPKKPWFKKWWVWVIAVVVVIGIGGALGGGDADTSAQEEPAAEEMSDPVEKEEPAEEPVKEEAEPEVPAEFSSALKKAQVYSDTMYMSKAGLYAQLTAEYGEQFSAEAAQYAVDNVKADWKKNALEKARTYQDEMAMSPAAIRDQLVSEHGEQFTPEEADYAVANL